MSIGNLKTDGGKGTNWPWQYRMLKGLEGIINAINTTAEAQEYEAKVVNISCTGDPFTGDRLYLEVRVFDTDTGTFNPPVYYLPGDNTPFPLTDFATCTITYPDTDVPYTLGQKPEAESVPVVIADGQTGVQRQTNMLRNSSNSFIGPDIYSASFANVHASGDVIITAGNGVSTALKPGETINFDPGAVNNTLDRITYDATAAEVLIIFIS